MLAAQALLSHQRLLLLQGPMGNFFNQLASWLRRHGAHVTKINFNGGDRLYHRRLNATDYRGQPEDFATWLQAFLLAHRIDAVVCFGDCRHYHRVAAQVCKEWALAFYAFEEGYLRPDYITLEQDGVNAHSRLAANPTAMLRYEAGKLPAPEPTRASFRRMAGSAASYYVAARLWRSRYPHYRHHKDFSPFREGFFWLRAGWRKALYHVLEHKLRRHIQQEWDQRYFLVPLQVFNDSQVLYHSPYQDVRDFIAELIFSFAQHAPEHTALVLKHHPLDRGHRNYSAYIGELARKNHVESRVFYMHDGHLPSLLKHSLGVVTINSTVGLSALHHDKPLITMGRALYDIPGLTCQTELHRFWCKPTPPQARLYRKLRAYLVKHTQLNGAYFGHSPWLEQRFPLGPRPATNQILG
ncbi:capsular polysaccharide export protein [Chromobacterium alkanivorans]|uniref:capsule biosynthesis protein n=1 Tax=Chromobacterium alkanivorans TaxID=1071719 RepID=UPI002168CE0C|nr:capsular biosynthesis protein [Chromobacterium alkanivorans]MCS3803357.1 capsular polysaccharide export protein [Chromobacterium alkanivorans]MCS3817533.1 capsular polysaccharide export protein [Chromobacterium alkanivorans]MCS3872723.1 capsular polysaccharide export protein [Chromobacterium alkanivorans]